MKLFGGKDQGDDATEMDAHDDTFDVEGGETHDGHDGHEAHDDVDGVDDDVAAEIEGADGAPAELSAPARAGGGGSGGSKKTALLGGLVLVLAGLGGGYYYLNSMGNDAIPVVPLAHKKTADALHHAADKIKDAATQIKTGALEMKNAAQGATVPPQPSPVASNQNLSVASNQNPPAAANQTPPVATSLADVSATAINTAAVANGPASAPVAALATPPAPVAAAAMPPAPAPKGANAAPDLPVPANMMQAAVNASAPDTSSNVAAAPAWAQPGAEVPATKAELARKAADALAAAKPSDAEMAIVQNAAVLDQLSQPVAQGAATPADIAAKAKAASVVRVVNAAPGVDKSDMKTVDQLLERDAIIRPLPEGYVTILKNHDAGDLDSRLARARVALADNNNAAALELFNELHNDYPKDTRVMMGRAVSLQKMGQTDDALAAYESVLNLNPKNLEALTNMLGLLRAKDPQLALSKLQQLREAYPYQPDIAAQLGVVYAQTGDYDNALKYLDMARALAPENAYVLYNQAVLFDKMGRSEKAGNLYRQIVRLAAEGSIKDPLPIDQIKQRLIDLH